jgi:hypothetical protein
MKKLDIAVNVTLAVAALLVVGLLIERRVAEAREETVRAGYVVGDELPETIVDPGKRTVLLFVSSTCQYCSASMPFYGRLLEEQRQRDQFDVIAVGFEPEERLRSYFGEHRVDIRAIRRATPGELKFRSTPTLIVTDASGIVEGAWVGLLAPDREEAVLTVLRESP